jgi:hypothetical protein
LRRPKRACGKDMTSPPYRHWFILNYAYII